MASANPRFHKSEEKFRAQCEHSLRNRLNEGVINERDAELIQLFVAEMRATVGISNSRAAKITGQLAGARRWIGPYDQIVTSDLYQAIDRINNEVGYTRNFKADVSRGLKRFCLWLCETGHANEGLAEVKIRKIKPQTFSKTTKKAEDLLTEDEVRAMIEHATTSRDRAIISMLYEGGFRIGELGELKWKQVTFNDWNVAISTDFKTGKSRHVPLVMSRSYLQAWVNDYPGTPGPDSFVFLTSRGDPLQYQGLVKRLRKIAESAGIERHITPHIFRHSRITHLIRQGYQESIIKKMCWGNPDTDMFSVYLHLVDEDVDNEIATRLGIKKRGRPTQASKALEPIQCPRCYTVHGPTARFCDQCGAALTEEAAQSIQIAVSGLEKIMTTPANNEIMPGAALRMKADSE